MDLTDYAHNLIFSLFCLSLPPFYSSSYFSLTLICIDYNLTKFLLSIKNKQPYLMTIMQPKQNNNHRKQSNKNYFL